MKQRRPQVQHSILDPQEIFLPLWLNPKHEMAYLDYRTVRQTREAYLESRN